MEKLDFTEYNAGAFFVLRPQGVAARARKGLARMRERALRRREQTSGFVSQTISHRVSAQPALDRRVGDVPSPVARLLSFASTLGCALHFLWRRVTSLGAIARIGKGNEKMKTRDGSAARPKRVSGITRPASERPHRTDDSIVEHYEKKLQELQRVIETANWEKTLAKECESLELMATLREVDWLGLRLLAHLRSSPMAAHELASACQMDLDCVAAAVARLFKFGAAELQDRLFTCTDKGRDILQNIEANASVKLTPQPELATMPG